MNRSWVICCSAALFIGSTSIAAAYVADGHEYELRCATDGYQLKSRNPVSRMVGVGAGSRFVTERETLFLGRSCDAYLKAFGYGQWCWANGGFFATFGKTEIRFPRQELWCEPERDYDLNCRC